MGVTQWIAHLGRQTILLIVCALAEKVRAQHTTKINLRTHGRNHKPQKIQLTVHGYDVNKTAPALHLTEPSVDLNHDVLHDLLWSGTH